MVASLRGDFGVSPGNWKLIDRIMRESNLNIVKYLL